MGLADVVRSAVATASATVNDLKDTVTWVAWTGQDGFGGQTYAAPVTLKALVEQKLHQRRLSDGRIVEVHSKVTILDPIPVVVANDRVNPIDSRDKFTLRDGSTGPILDTYGFQDPGTGKPYLMEVYLGSER